VFRNGVEWMRGIAVYAASEKSFNRDPKGSASTEGDRIPSVHALAAGSRLNEKRTNRNGNALEWTTVGNQLRLRPEDHLVKWRFYI